MPHCLVIDEYSVVRKVAARILSLAGYTVHSCDTPEEAGALLDGLGRVDIVIVSATLPGCTVEEAVRAIRGHSSAREATILASLVEANLGTMTRAKRAGANGFVYRPFDRAAMAEWLTAYVPAQRLAAIA